MGFPIRKFTDQSLFAAPHDLSQRTTSFIASQRQGIHRIPLRHLIALIARTRPGHPKDETEEQPRGRLFPPSGNPNVPTLKRPVLLQTHPGTRAVRLQAHDWCSRIEWRRTHDKNDPDITSKPFVSSLKARLAAGPVASLGPRPNALPLHNVIKTKTSALPIRILSPSRPAGLLEGRPTLAGRSRCPPIRRLPLTSPRLIGEEDETNLHRILQTSRPCRGPTLPPSPPQSPLGFRMVEPDGIEPTTSCLQSTRSPN